MRVRIINAPPVALARNARQYTLRGMRRTLGLAAAAIVLADSLSRAASPPHTRSRASVTVQTFVKPEPDRLRVIAAGAARAPCATWSSRSALTAFWTSTGREPLLLDAVTQWILPTLEIIEDGRHCRPPDLVVGPYLAAVRPIVSFVRRRARAHHSRQASTDDGAAPLATGLARHAARVSDRHRPQSRFAIQPGFETARHRGR